MLGPPKRRDWWVTECYADRGRPSIDPVVFYRFRLIMFIEGIRSERQLVETPHSILPIAGVWATTGARATGSTSGGCTPRSWMLPANREVIGYLHEQARTTRSGEARRVEDRRHRRHTALNAPSGPISGR